MNQLLGYLFASLISGIPGQNLENGISQMSFCYNTSSLRTCFTTFLDNNSRAVRGPFDMASDWCKTRVPGSSLIMINSLDEERTVGVFIGRQAQANETIIMDAQRFKATTKFEWIGTVGHAPIPREVKNKDLSSHGGACVEMKQDQSLTYCVGVVSALYRYICVSSDSRINPSYRQNNKSYVARQNRATWFDARLECLRLGGDLITHTDLQTAGNWSWLQKGQRYWIGLLQKKWIWQSTGIAVTYANWKGDYPHASNNLQCICIQPRCRTENRETISCDNDRKWRTCNCNSNYVIVCQREEETVAATTTISVNEEKSSSTSEDIESDISPSVNTTGNTYISKSSSSTSKSVQPTRQQLQSTTTSTTWKRSSTGANCSSSTKAKTTSTKTSRVATSTHTAYVTITTSSEPVNLTVITYAVHFATKTSIFAAPNTSAIGTTARPLKPSIPTVPNSTDSTVNTTHFTEGQTTDLKLSSSGQSNSISAKQILLIVLLFVVAIFIIVTVVLIFRRHKLRNSGSPTKNKNPSEGVSSVYATMVPENRPPEDTTSPHCGAIYTDVEMMQRPTSTNNAIYACVQPTGEAVDMSRNVVYADLDLPKKDRRKPRSSDQIISSLSPIYAQPFEPPYSTVYAEPFNPHNAIAPIRNHHTTVGDEQNVYSLAKSIPMGNPNAIYSEPYKAY